MAYPVLKEQTLLDLTVSPSLVATLDLLAKTGASQLDWEWGADDGQGYAYVRLISRELESITTDVHPGNVPQDYNEVTSRPLRDIMAEHDL